MQLMLITLKPKKQDGTGQRLAGSPNGHVNQQIYVFLVCLLVKNKATIMEYEPQPRQQRSRPTLSIVSTKPQQRRSEKLAGMLTPLPNIKSGKLVSKRITTSQQNAPIISLTTSPPKQRSRSRKSMTTATTTTNGERAIQSNQSIKAPWTRTTERCRCS